MTAKVSDLDRENARLQKDFEKLSKTHSANKVVLANDLGEMQDDLGKKMRESNSFCVKVCKLR